MSDKVLKISGLIAISTLFATIVFSQHPTAKWMVGHTTGGISEVANGNFYLFAARSKFSFELSPQASRFIRDNVQVGAQLGFSLENGDGLFQVVTGVVPFYRLDFRGVKKWTPYLEVGGGPFYVFNYDFEGLGVVGHFFYGMDYFILDRVAIGARVGGTYSRLEGAYTIGIPLRLGIQLLLGE